MIRKILLHNIVSFISLFSLYILFLHIFGGGQTVFFRGIAIIFANMIIICICIICYKKSLLQQYLYPIIVSSLLVYSIHITLPVVIDRSISVQILGTLAQEKQININDLHQKFLTGYVDGYSSTCRRINEQTKSGNVIIENDIVKITPRGEFAQKTFIFLAHLFAIEDHYATGEQDANYAFHWNFDDKNCIQ